MSPDIGEAKAIAPKESVIANNFNVCPMLYQGLYNHCTPIENICQLARPLGIEPSPRGLEALVLPIHHSRISIITKLKGLSTHAKIKRQTQEQSLGGTIPHMKLPGFRNVHVHAHFTIFCTFRGVKHAKCVRSRTFLNKNNCSDFRQNQE